MLKMPSLTCESAERMKIVAYYCVGIVDRVVLKIAKSLSVSWKDRRVSGVLFVNSWLLHYSLLLKQLWSYTS